jgi:hypothetical protein
LDEEEGRGGGFIVGFGVNPYGLHNLCGHLVLG